MLLILCRDKVQECSGPRASTEPAGVPALQRGETAGGVKPPLQKNFGLWSLRMALNGFDNAGQNGDRNRNVADGNQDGDDLGEKPQPRRVNRVAEAERLEHAP